MPYHLATPAQDSILPFREIRVKLSDNLRGGNHELEFHHMHAIFPLLRIAAIPAYPQPPLRHR